MYSAYVELVTTSYLRIYTSLHTNSFKTKNSGIVLLYVEIRNLRALFKNSFRLFEFDSNTILSTFVKLFEA
jgi:hypothetical protein